MTPLFAFSPTFLMIFAGIIGVLIFGRRLPEIGRSLGKTIVEFKKGMGGLEDDLDTAVSPRPAPAPRSSANAEIDTNIRPPQRVGTTAPKFEDTPASNSPQA